MSISDTRNEFYNFVQVNLQCESWLKIVPSQRLDGEDQHFMNRNKNITLHLFFLIPACQQKNREQRGELVNIGIRYDIEVYRATEITRVRTRNTGRAN